MRCIARKLACVIAIVGFAGSALAHVRIDHASPKVGSRITQSPKELKFWFDDDVVASGCALEVLDPAGQLIDKQDSHGDASDKTLVIVSLPADLSPGKYKVRWRAKCTDGHTTKGEFKFQVTTKGDPH
jgi:methionine-rich copper-binding protein CopC